MPFLRSGHQANLREGVSYPEEKAPVCRINERRGSPGPGAREKKEEKLRLFYRKMAFPAVRPFHARPTPSRRLPVARASREDIALWLAACCSGGGKESLSSRV